MCEEPVADGKLGKKTIARRKARHCQTETERRCEAAARRSERTKTGSKTCQGHIRPEGGTSSALGLHHTMTTQYWKQPMLVNTFLLPSSTRYTAALATDGSVSSSETIKTWAVSVARLPGYFASDRKSTRQTRRPLRTKQPNNQNQLGVGRIRI